MSISSAVGSSIGVVDGSSVISPMSSNLCSSSDGGSSHGFTKRGGRCSKSLGGCKLCWIAAAFSTADGVEGLDFNEDVSNFAFDCHVDLKL